MTEKELLKLKQKIADAEQSIQQNKGRIKELLEQLKEDFDVSTIKEAKQKKKELEKDLEKVTIKLKQIIAEINEKYNE